MVIPLHVLSAGYPTLNNMRALVAVNPEAAKHGNRRNMLPIQLFLLKQGS
jgi:hypothetical protein